MQRAHRKGRAGFTLVEMLIVIAILAVAATGVGLAIGALTRTHLRSGCMKLTAACRYAYNRAIVQHNTVRVLLDVENHRISIEEAHGHVTLAAKDDERRENAEEGEAQIGVDPWEAARARLEKTLEPSFGRSPFQPIRGPEGEELERYQPQPLGDEVRIRKMFLSHEEEPRDSGQGAIYFFPGGRTEHAVVQLTDDEGDAVYSVEVHPLTGRTKIYAEAYEPEELETEDFSELEDPGS